MRILVADHDATMVESTARALSDDFVVDVATSKLNCLAMLDVSEYHVIVAAERLVDGSGLELLSQAGKRWPDVLRVLSIEPDRVHLLGGRLKPFRLFETISYPIDPDQLRNVLLLAQAAEDAHVDTLTVQHIVLEDEVDGAEQQPAAAAYGAPAPRAAPPQARASQPTRGPAQRAGTPAARRAPFPAPGAQIPVARSATSPPPREAVSAPVGRSATSPPRREAASTPVARGTGSASGRGAASGPLARGAASAPARQAAPAPAAGKRGAASASGSAPAARGASPTRSATSSGGAPASRTSSRGAPAAPASRSASSGAGQRSDTRRTASGRATLSAAVGFDSPASPPSVMAGPPSRRVGDRRAGSEQRGTISVSTEPMFAGADSLAEAAEIAASLRPRLGAPDTFGKRRTMMFVAVGLGLAVVAVVAAMMFSGSDAPPAAPAASIAEPTLQPAASAAPVTQQEQPLALASVPSDAAAASSDPPEVAAFVADIESALTMDDFARARGLLDTLREIAPDHPRLTFFTSLISRGEEMQAIEAGGADLPEPPTLGPAIRSAARKRDVPASSPRAEVSRPTTPAADRDVERNRAASLRALAPAAPDRGEVEKRRTSSLRAVTPAAPDRGEVEKQRTASLRAVTPAAPDREVERQRAASLRALAPPGPAVSGSADPRRSASPVSPATAASADTRLRPAASPPAASLAPSRAPAPAPTVPAGTFSGRTLEETGRSTAPPSGSAQPRTIVLPVVKEARLVRQVDPEYPRDARRGGIEGSIDLRFTVKADGKVADIEVVQATPADTFDREAIAAVRRWRYEPRREDGVPVDSRTRVRLEFKLDGQNRRR